MDNDDIRKRLVRLFTYFNGKPETFAEYMLKYSAFHSSFIKRISKSKKLNTVEINNPEDIQTIEELKILYAELFDDSEDDNLEAALQEAINNEDFEMAIIIRDKLKKIKKKR